jgi:hypothetical protein
MTARIIAAGVAIALIVLAVQAGTSLRSWATARVEHGAKMPAVLILPAGRGTITCQLKAAAYTCTAPQVLIPPPEPVVAGAR